jgi:hypothetical protein
VERVAELEEKLKKRNGARVILIAKALHAGQRPAGRVWWDELAPLTKAERLYVFAKLREWRK